MLALSQRSPLAGLNYNARPRTERLLSLAFGLPPPTEKRATTGTLSPLNTDALDSARPASLLMK